MIFYVIILVFMSVQSVFDFESVLPAAVRDALQASAQQASLEIKAYVISDPAEFQKIRPRVEVVYKHLGEASPKRYFTFGDGSGRKRTCAFRGELRIVAISDVDEPGKLAHSAYRALVRFAISNLEEQLNGEILTEHKIQFVVSGNEETGVRTADGYQQTTFP